MRAAGAPRREIADELGLTVDQVAVIVRGLAIPKRPKIPWTAEENARIADLRTAGWSNAGIARELGISVIRVKNIVSRLKGVPGRRDFERARREAAVETAVREGLTAYKAAMRHRTAPGPVAEMLKGRPDWNPVKPRQFSVNSEEMANRVAELAKSGMRISDVAQEVGMDYHPCYALWRRHPDFALRVPKTGAAAERRRRIAMGALEAAAERGVDKSRGGRHKGEDATKEKSE